MAELQKEFSALNAEMKEIESIDKRVANRVKFADYQFKVGVYGHSISEAEKIAELTDEDRESGHVGLSGLAYTGFDSRSQAFDYVMLHNREEYDRVKRILTMLEAAQALSQEGTKDKERHLKVLLGES
jgi:hypothetical protein